jgi:hypothetical protein
MPHEERQGNDKFTPVEADIRAAFDRALDGLERFRSYVATGLVKIGDLGLDRQEPRSQQATA